jgi:tRNA A-37 threonylcarbamoyl transferase component Bud32
MAGSLRQARSLVNAYPAHVQEPRTVEVAGVRWWLREGADAAALAPLLARALQQRDGAEDLRSGRRKRLFRLALGSGGEPEHLLKRSGYRPSRGWLRHARGSKARRELRIAEALARRGVPVVVPLAAGERRRAGRLVECFLLAPLLADAVDLRRLWSDPALAPGERRGLAVSLGGIVAAAHAAGLFQDDLAPNNVLVSDAGAGRLRLVDFERARLRWLLSTRARSRMLAKLARTAAAVPATQRLRFLRAYAGDAAQARRWWARLRSEAPRLARRDDTRMRRTAVRNGRRFQAFERGDSRGFTRRGLDPGLVLGGAPAGLPPAAGSVRVEIDGGVWRVVYPRASERRMRGLWARANTLAARGLAPLPLAVRSDPDHTLLIYQPGAGARPPGATACGAAERWAVARLLRELEGFGELRAELAPEALVLIPTGTGRLRAQLLAPHAFRFGGRCGGRRSRGLAARLLASLGPPASGVQFDRSASDNSQDG